MKNISLSLTAKKIIEAVDKMPSLSPTVSKTIQIVNDITATPKQLMDVIKLDPILTGKVLKLINSAFFGLPQKITALDRAIILVGVNTIKNLALSTAVAGSFCDNKKVAARINMEELWLHALGVAVTSKLIAREIKIPRPLQEEFFIAGLLHDIGKLLLVQYFPDEYAEVVDEIKVSGASIIEVEHKRFQANHEEVGGLLSEKWRLYDSLIEPIVSHHSPNFDSSSTLTNVVYLSNILCINNEIGFICGQIKRDIGESILKKVGITRDQIESVIKKIPGELAEAARIIKIGDD
ncbi:HDOD domain-containing protein [bacterium]|nr:HDOD domain-containing protein [bacterium]